MSKQQKPEGKANVVRADNQESLMEQLKQFVRTKGPEYLKDQNVTSIGIGYKITKNRPTGQICVQFTVNKKLASPEAMGAANTTHIPESFSIGGADIPTDVLERNYETSYKLMPEATPGQQKTRMDPIQPGISVANINSSAGTIGCIVYDKADGAAYILSNWHVLHGPEGNIGDKVVQPGPWDDNRTGQNHLGRLIRSHLGEAGDCAISSIEGRGVDSRVLELSVIPDSIGEPELGDRVTKSGRTTGVTHGIVNRVHTLVKINYGGNTGVKAVGCFEIGPDPDFLPEDGEISKGGDSGSIWLFKNVQGQITAVMAGLHFAGESSSSQPEHALACYGKSVLEKMDVSLKPVASTVPTTKGYDPAFLGSIVTPPVLQTPEDAVKVNGSISIDYTHFSLALHKERRFAIWVAWNIDGGNIKRFSRRGLRFALDPRIDAAFQTGDSLYAGNRLDRGHIARRADLLWGDDRDAQAANRDSFYFTNIAPQMDHFNQSNQGGIWGKLEDALFEDANVENLRVSLFGGPVFRTDDRIYRNTLIPDEFYKVIAYVDAGQLKAKAFLLTQSLAQLEVLDLEPFKVYQVNLSEIETRCRFTFSTILKQAEFLPEGLPDAPEQRQPLSSVRDIVW
jgi:endonuclease G, mitochondrial